MKTEGNHWFGTLEVPGDFDKSGFNSGVRFQHLAEEGKGEYRREGCRG